MQRHSCVDRCHRPIFRVLTLLLLITVGIAAPLCGVRAAVTIYGFEATPQSNASILLVWQTGSEFDTLAFEIRRGESPDDLPLKLGTVPAQSTGAAGGSYRFTDQRDLRRGVRYYYQIVEVTSNSAEGDKSSIISAGIDMPTLTPTLRATATAIATATATTVQSGAAATSTATATSSVPGSASSEQPTATRQFANTPVPATPAPGSTPTPVLLTSATAAPVGSGVVSTPTGGPQPQSPPTAAPANAVATTAPTSPPPATSVVPMASPTPEIVTTSAVQPALELTPAATQPPKVFAAATVQPLLGTPGRDASRPTPAPDGEEPRDTGTFLLLGGGAIVLAAALAGGVLLLMRSRRPVADDGRIPSQGAIRAVGRPACRDLVGCACSGGAAGCLSFRCAAPAKPVRSGRGGQGDGGARRDLRGARRRVAAGRPRSDCTPARCAVIDPRGLAGGFSVGWPGQESGGALLWRGARIGPRTPAGRSIGSRRSLPSGTRRVALPRGTLLRPASRRRPLSQPPCAPKSRISMMAWRRPARIAGCGRPSSHRLKSRCRSRRRTRPRARPCFGFAWLPTPLRRSIPITT